MFYRFINFLLVFLTFVIFLTSISFYVHAESNDEEPSTVAEPAPAVSAIVEPLVTTLPPSSPTQT